MVRSKRSEVLTDGEFKRIEKVEALLTERWKLENQIRGYEYAAQAKLNEAKVFSERAKSEGKVPKGEWSYKLGAKRALSSRKASITRVTNLRKELREKDLQLKKMVIPTYIK